MVVLRRCLGVCLLPSLLCPCRRVSVLRIITMVSFVARRIRLLRVRVVRFIRIPRIRSSSKSRSLSLIPRTTVTCLRLPRPVLITR